MMIAVRQSWDFIYCILVNSAHLFAHMIRYQVGKASDFLSLAQDSPISALPIRPECWAARPDQTLIFGRSWRTGIGGPASSGKEITHSSPIFLSTFIPRGKTAAAIPPRVGKRQILITVILPIDKSIQ